MALMAGHFTVQAPPHLQSRWNGHDVHKVLVQDGSGVRLTMIIRRDQALVYRKRGWTLAWLGAGDDHG